MQRIDAQPHDAARGLAALVVGVVDLLRQLLERQALHRIDSGSLSEEQIERLGETFLELERGINSLKQSLHLEPAGAQIDRPRP